MKRKYQKNMYSMYNNSKWNMILCIIRTTGQCIIPEEYVQFSFHFRVDLILEFLSRQLSLFYSLPVADSNFQPL